MQEQRQIRTLLSYSNEIMRFKHEARPADFAGPQQACHPEHLELCFIESGVEQICTGKRRDQQRRGQFSAVAPGVVHSSWSTHRPVQESIFHLTSQSIAALAAELKIGTIEWPRRPIETPRTMHDIVHAIKDTVRQEPTSGQRLLIDSLAHTLQMLVLNHLFQTSDRAVGHVGTSERNGLQVVEEQLRSRMGESYSLEQLARSARMSKFHLVRCFKQRYGLPPHAYQLRLRLERAAELMRSTELPLTTIAYDLGFGASSRLSESFKRLYGVSPSSWRRSSSAISGKPGSKMPVSA